MTSRTAAGERWALVDRRDFLRRSLDDAAREHEAGDLDDTDYRLLRERDLAALAEVEAALEALDRPGPDGPGGTTEGVASEREAEGSAGDGGGGQGSPAAGTASGRQAGHAASDRSAPRRRRAWLAVGGVAAVVAGAVLLVVSLTSTRLPGEVATGSIKTSQEQQVDRALDQAVVLVNEGRLVEALQAYEGVLAIDPHQRTALAESGWLEWESGSQSGTTSLEAKGRAQVERAVRAAPGFYAARAYLGTIDLDQGDAQAATVQYGKFLADHPPASWVRTYAPEIRTAYTNAGQPVPAGVPSGAGAGSGSGSGSGAGSATHAGS